MSNITVATFRKDRRGVAVLLVFLGLISSFSFAQNSTVKRAYTCEITMSRPRAKSSVVDVEKINSIVLSRKECQTLAGPFKKEARHDRAKKVRVRLIPAAKVS